MNCASLTFVLGQSLEAQVYAPTSLRAYVPKTSQLAFVPTGLLGGLAAGRRSPLDFVYADPVTQPLADGAKTFNSIFF